MESLADVFTAAFNWCDRRCERCPITGDCPVWRRELQRRWVHEARGRDPEDPALFEEDMLEELRRVEHVVREHALAEGIDLDAPLPNQPIPLGARRLKAAGLALSVAVRGYAQDEELARVALTLTMKSARLASHMEEPSSEVWAADAAPNLLLVARLRGALGARLVEVEADAGARPDSLTRALDDFDRILDPLVAAVSASAKSIVDALVERGVAPSPFCTVACGIEAR